MPKKKKSKAQENATKAQENAKVIVDDISIEPIAEKEPDRRSKRSTSSSVTPEDEERTYENHAEVMERLRRAVRGAGFTIVQDHHFPSATGRVFMVHCQDTEEREASFRLAPTTTTA